MQQWEYRYIEIPIYSDLEVEDWDEWIGRLNHYGRDGWELVLFDYGILIMKRPFVPEPLKFKVHLNDPDDIEVT